jgi:hypothetical protein
MPFLVVSVLHALQLLSHPPKPASHPSNGSGHCRPRLEHGRTGRIVGQRRITLDSSLTTCAILSIMARSPMPLPIIASRAASNEPQQVYSWLPLLVEIGKGALFFTAGACFTHFLAGRRDKRQRAALACSNFRKAFAELRNLCRGASLARVPIKTYFGQQDSAIADLLPHLRKRDRAGFEAACEKYRKCRTPPPSNSVFSAMFFSEEQTQALGTAIDDLLTYADSA